MSNKYGVIFMIPSGEAGERYVKLISGDETMTVKRYAEHLVKRAKEAPKELERIRKQLHKGGFKSLNCKYELK